MGKYYVRTKGPNDWKALLANPDKHWKKGYSAYELAHSWESAVHFPPCVDCVFKKSSYSLFHNLQVLYGFPEYSVPLPGGGGSSQNDLYILAKADDELLPIMVEGKVSEPFGQTVENWMGSAPSNGKRSRLDFLLKLLNLEEDYVLKIRYQLLHRAASALLEAKKLKSNKAIMLIHSFSETGKGYEDYEEFVRLFQLSSKKETIIGPTDLNGISLYFGWVSGERVESIEEN